MAASEEKANDNMKSLGWKFLNKETFGNGMKLKLSFCQFQQPKFLISTPEKCNPHKSIQFPIQK